MEEDEEEARTKWMRMRLKSRSTMYVGLLIFVKKTSVVRGP